MLAKHGYLYLYHEPGCYARILFAVLLSIRCRRKPKIYRRLTPLVLLIR